MIENKSSPLPHFQSLPDLVEYFDSHDMGEHWEHMPEADFEVNIDRKYHFVSIDEDLLNQLTEIAQSQQNSVETLIHSWLWERIAGNNR